MVFWQQILLSVIGLCGAIGLVLLSWTKLQKVLSKPRGKKAGQVAEVLFAIASSPIIALFEIYKKDSWGPTNIGWALLGTTLAVISLVFYISFKIHNLQVKEKEGQDAKELELLTNQRDWATRVRELVGAIVNQKMMRLRSAWLDGNLTCLEKVYNALDPRQQIQEILISLHRVYQSKLAPGHKIRLGVYMKVDHHMEVAFGWDGDKHKCFNTNTIRYMEIDDPDSGPKSLITQLYHSAKTIKIVPNCEAAAQVNDFEFFKPEQRKYLCSMVALKKMIHTDKREAVILTLDTDQNDFFRLEDEEEIELCCGEILKRLEFELLMLSIVTHPTPPSKTINLSPK